MKTFMLQLSYDNMRQLNDEGNYYCTFKSDECFDLWNMYHKKIDKAYYDKNCKGLTILMELDGMIKTK